VRLIKIIAMARHSRRTRWGRGKVWWGVYPFHTGNYPFHAHCCHMDTATKHLAPDRVKQSFVCFDIRALCRSGLSVRVPGCQKLQMTV